MRKTCGCDGTIMTQSPGALVGAPLDITRPDHLLYKTYTYNDDGCEVTLVIPYDGVSVTRVVKDEVTIWTRSPGEKMEYAKLYLKNGQPALMYVVKAKDTFMEESWYSLEEGKWVVCSNNYMEKMDGLRVHAEPISEFTIDLSASTSSDQCTIFQDELYGIDTRFFFPNNGYTAKEVRDGSTIIWTSSGDTEHCLPCELYLKRGEPSFFVLTIRDDEVHQRYFLKDGGEWLPSTHYAFKSFRTNFFVWKNGDVVNNGKDGESRREGSLSAITSGVSAIAGYFTSHPEVDAVTKTVPIYGQGKQPPPSNDGPLLTSPKDPPDDIIHDEEADEDEEEAEEEAYADVERKTIQDGGDDDN